MSLARRLYERAHLRGHFVLRSGQEADEYFDKYRFESDPVLLREVADAMAPLVPGGAEVLAGLELGGIPIATALSLTTGLRTVFVRKKAKDYGTRRLAEGGEVIGRQLVIVEDVVTTGGQIIASAGALREDGASVDTVLCVIDREQGGRENLAAHGLDLYPLYTMTDLQSC